MPLRLEDFMNPEDLEALQRIQVSLRRLEPHNHMQQYEQQLVTSRRGILILARREADAQRWKHWAGFIGEHSSFVRYVAREEDLRGRRQEEWELVRVDGWQVSISAYMFTLRDNFPDWRDSCDFSYSDGMRGFELVGGSSDRIRAWEELRSHFANGRVSIPRQPTAADIELDLIQRQIEVRLQADAAGVNAAIERCQEAIANLDRALQQSAPYLHTRVDAMRTHFTELQSAIVRAYQRGDIDAVRGAQQNSRSGSIKPLHACCHCAYFVPQPFNTCNAFHSPEPSAVYQQNECPDWEAK